MRGSTTIELLTAATGDTLTATLTNGSVTNGVRVDSESQFQVFIDYTPHASKVGDASVYAEWELLYTEQAADYADVSGGSGTITWKTYTEETTLAETATIRTSGFLIKRWRAYADDTDAKDRDPTFSVPLGVKRVNIKMMEVGMGTSFGKLIAKVGHQCI